MPNVDVVYGIKMNVYSADHLPPHFHAIYNEREAVILISDGSDYQGSLPARQLQKTRSWLAENREDVLKVFYQLNPKLKTNERKENKKSAKGTKDK